MIMICLPYFLDLPVPEDFGPLSDLLILVHDRVFDGLSLFCVALLHGGQSSLYLVLIVCVQCGNVLLRRLRECSSIIEYIFHEQRVPCETGNE